MEKQKVRIIHRLLFILLVVVIFFLVKSYRCIILEFSSTPKIFTNYKNYGEFLFLYGPGLCNTCAPGRLVLSLREKKQIVFVLPDDFSSVDIENFKESFMVQGKVIKGNEEIVNFLKRVGACKNVESWMRAYHFRYSNDGKLTLLGIL